jgi:two-component system sensor histidine kinase ChiS
LLAKENFLNNISHEMRTPMQGIYGIAQDLKDNWQIMENDRKLAHLKLIIKSSERLISLFCNLLDLGKLSANQMTMNFEHADLQEIVEDVISEFEYSNFTRNIKIVFNKSKTTDFSTKLDKIRIAQVVRNIVSNAIRYSSEGEIIVTIECDAANNFVVCVRDNGIGIPEEELGVIFLPFIQSTRTKTNAGGTGLGLSICAEIINLHKGKIWALNNPEGGASIFFSLPFVASQKGEFSSIVRKINALGDVMILDDEQLAIESGTIILSSVGFKNILSAMDCKTCLEQIEKSSISILFLDMMLPDMSGLEFLKLLRQNSKFDYIKVIICSGICDTKDVQEAMRMGALAHFSKPYNKSQILDGISNLFFEFSN